MRCRGKDSRDSTRSAFVAGVLILQGGEIDGHTKLPTAVVFHEPIDERSMIVDVLSFDSDPRMLCARHERAAIRKVDLDIAELHEGDLSRYARNRSGERLRVLGIATRCAMNEAGGQEARHQLHVASPDGVRHRQRCLHHAFGIVHARQATMSNARAPPPFNGAGPHSLRGTSALGAKIRLTVGPQERSESVD